jgi:cell wall-associated protease
MKFSFIILMFLWPCFSNAQHPNWQNKDLKSDSVFGISTEKAYKELIRNRKPSTVLVAVIDGGVDTAQEDLKSVIWTNPKELYNHLDDDHNGYADDLHGWNFIGGPGGDVQYDNLELTRIVRQQKPFYDSLRQAGIPAGLRAGYDSFRTMQSELNDKWFDAESNYRNIGAFKEVLDGIVKKMGKENPTVKDFQDYKTEDENEKRVRLAVIGDLSQMADFTTFYNSLNSDYDHFKTKAEYQLNVRYDPRSIVNDNYNDMNDRYYGNADVTGPSARHGTHVSGIIGARRNNGIGMDGIADQVLIMALRVVPDGDERDKDVANGIRYAVDNGARVINMSFGKGYSPGKKAVDDAVQYAMRKDVLIVHGAGNDAKNLDSASDFPSRRYADGQGEAAAWIEVGASGEKNDSTLVATFSNYGRHSVDVFAPGVKIYSTLPGNQYAYFDGTSMASPVVAGLAALIRSYYPNLTAVQVKDIILRSVTRVGHKVLVKDIDGDIVQIPFSETCVSGGVVNAYQAMKLAETYHQ